MIYTNTFLYIQSIDMEDIVICTFSLYQKHLIVQHRSIEHILNVIVLNNKDSNIIIFTSYDLLMSFCRSLKNKWLRLLPLSLSQREDPSKTWRAEWQSFGRSVNIWREWFVARKFQRRQRYWYTKQWNVWPCVEAVIESTWLVSANDDQRISTI